MGCKYVSLIFKSCVLYTVPLLHIVKGDADFVNKSPVKFGEADYFLATLKELKEAGSIALIRCSPLFLETKALYYIVTNHRRWKNKGRCREEHLIQLL